MDAEFGLLLIEVVRCSAADSHAATERLNERLEQMLLNAYADGRRDERQEREAWEANVAGLQWSQTARDGLAAWRVDAMKPETAESVQASAIAENQSMQIPGMR
jgi:hypothetical protein